MGESVDLLNAYENAAAADFIRGHRCKKGATRVAVVTVTPTGIADNIRVKCAACGKEKDVSDYGSW